MYNLPIRPGLNSSNGRYLNNMEAQQGPPQIVQPLDEPQPELELCLTNQPASLVHEEDPSVLLEGRIDLVKASDPVQAYVFDVVDGHIQRWPLQPNVPGWGDLFVCKVLPRRPDGVYLIPNPDRCERVAIKCLNKQVVERERRAGNRKDPYREIYRMQTIGDNVHVLKCEALYDETNIYIVMPYCEEHSLFSTFLFFEDGLPEAEARGYFQQMFENLTYLRDHQICHRDLSLDNCLIYQGRVVFSDFSHSFRLPPDAVHVHGTADPHGTIAYQPPDVLQGLPYHAYKCDLWAAVVSLFNLLTGEMLYSLPVPGDLKFCFFILCGGISMTPRHDLMNEIWIGLNEAQRQEFGSIMTRYLELSQEVKEIFDGVLRMSDRWDLDAVAAHLPLWI